MQMRYAQWKIASMYASHKDYRKGMYGPPNAPETTVLENIVEVAFTYILPTTPALQALPGQAVHPESHFNPERPHGDVYKRQPVSSPSTAWSVPSTM